MKFENSEQVLEEYRKASDIVENVLGIRYPEPDAVHLVGPEEDSPLATIIIPGLFGGFDKLEKKAMVKLIKRPNESWGSELFIRNDLHLSLSELIHEGAHVYQIINNQRLCEEMCKNNIPTKKISEGFASRIQQYIQKSQLHSLLNKFIYYFNEFHDTVSFDNVYHKYRNLFSKINDWKKELEIAMTCANDVELERAVSSYKRKKQNLLK